MKEPWKTYRKLPNTNPHRLDTLVYLLTNSIVIAFGQSNSIPFHKPTFNDCRICANYSVTCLLLGPKINKILENFYW